jgi:hypothetical protein
LCFPVIWAALLLANATFGKIIMDDQFTGFLVAAIGVFAFCGAQFQWAFFMEHRRIASSINHTGEWR